jgi:hypothetical protein
MLTKTPFLKPIKYQALLLALLSEIITDGNALQSEILRGVPESSRTR